MEGLFLTHLDFVRLIGVNINVIPFDCVKRELKFNLHRRGTIGGIVHLEDVVAIYSCSAVLRVVFNCRFKSLNSRLHALHTKSCNFESSYKVLTICG